MTPQVQLSASVSAYRVARGACPQANDVTSDSVASGGQAPRPDDATLTMALTGKNEIVGTLYYMSPEQLQAQANGQEIDGPSDIFSFGLVLYERLTGKRAFEGSSPASVIAAIMDAVVLRRETKRNVSAEPAARTRHRRRALVRICHDNLLRDVDYCAPVDLTVFSAPPHAMS